MKLFLSWSGDRSRELALALRKWLPLVLQGAHPWMSEHDIEKGSWWNADIVANIEQSKMGIICLTPENVNAAWVLFESGALSRSFPNARVCPYLLNLSKSDLRLPLAQFMAATTSEDDTRKLVQVVNTFLSEPLSEASLSATFEKWWPSLQTTIHKIEVLDKKAEPPRSDSDVVREILQLTRNQFRLVSNFELQWFSKESLHRLEALLSRAGNAPPQVRRLLGVVLPDIGEGVQSGELVRWCRKVGDFVRDSDPLAEVMVNTDESGATVEIPAFASGFLVRTLHAEGTEIGVGDLIALLATSEDPAKS